MKRSWWARRAGSRRARSVESAVWNWGAVVELAELGLVSPRGYAPEQWQLPAAALPRLAVAARLMRDLGLNVSGAALAVELLEEQRELERHIRRLERLANT